MIRPTTILALLILAGSVFGLFQVKYRVQALQRDLAEIDRQLEEEKNAGHVLKAEWAYLNQPERLRMLVDRHLQLGAITVSQLRETVDPASETAVAAVASPAPAPIASAAAPKVAPVKVAALEPKTEPKKNLKAQKLAKLEKPAAKPKALAARESRKVERLANNAPPVYTNMDSLLSSLQ